MRAVEPRLKVDLNGIIRRDLDGEGDGQLVRSRAAWKEETVLRQSSLDPVTTRSRRRGGGCPPGAQGR